MAKEIGVVFSKEKANQLLKLIPKADSSNTGSPNNENDDLGGFKSIYPKPSDEQNESWLVLLGDEISDGVYEGSEVFSEDDGELSINPIPDNTEVEGYKWEDAEGKFLIYEINGKTGLSGKYAQVWLTYKKDGEPYFYFNAGGGDAASTEWHAYFIGESDELVTWAVAEDDPLPEVIPSIMAFVKGKIINDKGTTTTDALELFNFGADEGVEPDPPTTEIVLAAGSTHWFYVKLSNLNNVTVTYELANSSSEPDVDSAPSGEKWVILCKVDAVTDTYPDTRSGTKFTITQINEGPIDLRSTGGLFVVRLTNAVSNNEYDAYLQTSSDIATRTDGDAVTAKTIVSLGAALTVGADAYHPAYKEGDYYYIMDVARFK